MKTKTIHVTEADIAKGEGKNAFRCPIAYASTRAFFKNHGGIASVSDLSIHVYLRSGEPGGSYRLPRKAQSWLLAFDAGREVKPFSFSINLEGAVQ